MSETMEHRGFALPQTGATIAEAGRVRLRRWCAGDLAHYAALVADPVVMAHIGDGRPRGPDRARREVERFVAAQNADGFSRWVVERRSDGRFMGYIGPLRNDSFIDYGGRGFRALWGSGLIVDIVSVALETIFLTCRIENIVAITRIANARAWRVNQRMGFYEAGQIEQHGHPCLIQHLDRETYLRKDIAAANRALLTRFLQRGGDRHVTA
jgi:RimJ/RimL family protein N-acetyltransferase